MGGLAGTGLVFWNSCDRRRARLECGNRLRTRTFMETCCWRQRRRQPEGSQRLERQRRRRPDPCPHPGVGRAQPLLAPPGHSLVAGSKRVRRVAGGRGERGARGGGGVGAGGGCRETLPATAPGPPPRGTRVHRPFSGCGYPQDRGLGGVHSWVSLSVSASTGLRLWSRFPCPAALLQLHLSSVVEFRVLSPLLQGKSPP